MTLQRRLLLLLAGVPLIWFAALLYSLYGARAEINELFDTQQIRLAQQVGALLPSANFSPSPLHPAKIDALGAAELDDLSVAVWSSDGTPLLFDREGAALPFVAGRSGFIDLQLKDAAWRVYYLPAAGGRLVAVGQSEHERDELLRDLLIGQLLPWLLTLPLLLFVIGGAVRRALAPLRSLASDLAKRGPEDLRAVSSDGLPRELQPVVASLNQLFERIGCAIEQERRLTADAAHELRTPLAALRAQWEAAQLAQTDGERREQLERVGVGIERLGRLVSQLLALATLESANTTTLKEEVDWQRVIGDALSDCLPLMERKSSDVEVHWPKDRAALPVLGDAPLLTTLLRNLIDNALRYSSDGTHVQVRFDPDAIVIEDDGPGVTEEQLAQLGSRFRRSAGQRESGSGLGISIAQRIAALHGLEVRFGNRGSARGLRVEVRRRSPRSLTALRAA